MLTISPRPCPTCRQKAREQPNHFADCPTCDGQGTVYVVRADFDSLGVAVDTLARLTEVKDVRYMTEPGWR